MLGWLDEEPADPADPVDGDVLDGGSDGVSDGLMVVDVDEAGVRNAFGAIEATGVADDRCDGPEADALDPGEVDGATAATPAPVCG